MRNDLWLLESQQAAFELLLDCSHSRMSSSKTHPRDEPYDLIPLSFDSTPERISSDNRRVLCLDLRVSMRVGGRVRDARAGDGAQLPRCS